MPKKGVCVYFSFIFYLSSNCTSRKNAKKNMNTGNVHLTLYFLLLFKYIHSFILSFRTEKILQDSGVTIAPPARSVGKGGVAISSASPSAAGTLSKPLTCKRVAEVVEDEGEGEGDDGDGDDENQKAGEEEEKEEEEEMRLRIRMGMGMRMRMRGKGV